jgi:phosphotransferase system HPr (HPr) family protein
MVEASYLIGNKRGLHARAAAKFVNLASTFASRIVVRHGDEEADGKSILSLMVLGAAPGAEVLVRVEGPDEVAALAALGALIGGRFDEQE